MCWCADWYVTLLEGVLGVDGHDAVEIGGATHDVDGVNMWPAITSEPATHTHALSLAAAEMPPAKALDYTHALSLLAICC